MNEDYEGVEQSAPSAELAKSRGRGASLLTIRIYAAVAEAGPDGLMAAEIHDRIKDVPGFASDTERWWHERMKFRESSTSFNLHDAGLERVKTRVHSMVIADENGTMLRRLRHGGPYIAGRPPKGYRPKRIVQRPWGWYDIDPKADEAATRRHIETVNVIREGRTLLGRKNPKGLREWAERALALLES